MMPKTFSIIKKNFLSLFHSKLSSLILILGPIFLILILGMGLGNTGLRDIETSIYIKEQSNFTNLFLEDLEARSFIISEFDSLEECISQVKNSDKNLCIELRKSEITLPEDFEIDSKTMNESGLGYDVQLYVDFSKQRIVWGIISSVERSVSYFSSGLREKFSKGLKMSLEEYSNEITQAIKQIDSIDKGYLSSINSRINRIGANLFETSKEIENIDNSFNSLEQEILQIDNMLQSLMPPIESSLYQDFNNLKFVWENAEIKERNNEIKDHLSAIKTRMSGIRVDLMSVKRSLEETQESLNNIGNINLNYISSPILLKYNSISDNFSGEIKIQFSFLDYIFPSFLSFFILLVSVTLATSFTIKERKSPAYIRNMMSKTSGINFLFSNFITILMIVVLQCAIILGIASFFLTFSLFSYLPSLIIPLLLSISLFVIIGMLIGYLFNSHETAVIASISLTLLLIIFSPLISPLETLPHVLRIIFSYTPIVLAEDVFRRILIFESDLGRNMGRIIAIGISSIVFSLILFATYYLKKYTEVK